MTKPEKDGEGKTMQQRFEEDQARIAELESALEEQGRLTMQARAERDARNASAKRAHDLYMQQRERTASAEARLAEAEKVVEHVARRHRRTTYLKPPYECQCGEIRCVYLAALDAWETL